MTYLYNSRNKTIKRLTPCGFGKTYDLTPLESRLLEVLSNGLLNTKKEISTYVFGYYDNHVDTGLSRLKVRLYRKAKLNIETLTGRRIQAT